MAVIGEVGIDQVDAVRPINNNNSNHKMRDPMSAVWTLNAYSASRENVYMFS